MSYTYSASTGMAVRSSDGASVPWDAQHDRPLDMAGDAGSRWVADGSPASIPAASPLAPAPTVTGNQWAFALNSLGLASAWRVGVAKSKDGDQNRIALLARDTPLVASDPLLIRVAANAGTDSSGNPLIVVATVFSTAQGMPL